MCHCWNSCCSIRWCAASAHWYRRRPGVRGCTEPRHRLRRRVRGQRASLRLRRRARQRRDRGPRGLPHLHPARVRKAPVWADPAFPLGDRRVVEALAAEAPVDAVLVAPVVVDLDVKTAKNAASLESCVFPFDACADKLGESEILLVLVFRLV